MPSRSFLYYAELTVADKVTRLSETDLSARSCKARNGNLRCTLDAHHRNLGSAHIHRTDDGSLVSFRLEENE